MLLVKKDIVVQVAVIVVILLGVLGVVKQALILVSLLIALQLNMIVLL
jgi:hypothetical protein